VRGQEVPPSALAGDPRDGRRVAHRSARAGGAMKTYGYILIALAVAYLVIMFWQPKWGINRKYKSGSRWAFWRWTITDSDYIRRLHIFKCPWFAICLHFIRKPDVEPHMHDHPVTF